MHHRRLVEHRKASEASHQVKPENNHKPHTSGATRFEPKCGRKFDWIGLALRWLHKYSVHRHSAE